MLPTSVCVFGLMFTIPAYILVDLYLLWRVNEKLPMPERISWWQKNRFRVLQFDRRFYPNSPARLIYWALVVATMVFGWVLVGRRS